MYSWQSVHLCYNRGLRLWWWFNYSEWQPLFVISIWLNVGAWSKPILRIHCCEEIYQVIFYWKSEGSLIETIFVLHINLSFTSASSSLHTLIRTPVRKWTAHQSRRLNARSQDLSGWVTLTLLANGGSVGAQTMIRPEPYLLCVPV